MNRLAQSFWFVLAILFFLIITSKNTQAASLQWQKSNGVNLFSQDIRISKTNTSISYATQRAQRYGGFSGLYSSFDSGINFLNILATSSGRDVNAIAISKTNPNKVWISSYEQGVFSTIDSGLHWIQHSFGTTKLRYITIDPTNDSVLYVGAGEYNSGGGIYKTIDGGLSWSKIGESSLGSRNYLNIYVDQFDHTRVFAGSDTALFVSTDSGSTWSPLTLTNAPYPATIVDTNTPTIIYASANDLGIYKSIDNGNTWVLKNSNMGASLVFRLAQDTNGTLYATKIGNGGGIWRSTDKAESWEDVSDPSWVGSNTWGLDASNGQVFVGVEGFGIYHADVNNFDFSLSNTGDQTIAKGQTATESISVNLVSGLSQSVTFSLSGVPNGIASTMSQTSCSPDCSLDLTFVTDYTSPTGTFPIVVTASNGGLVKQTTFNLTVNPPDGPNPVVFIPGFGASFSTSLVDNGPTTYKDWSLVPVFGDKFYGNFLTSLGNANLVKDQNYFVFAYDYRKPLSETAFSLNDFLLNEVIPKNLGKKINVAAHSMGGLVVRYCYDMIVVCAAKIDKVATGGTPHWGVLESYLFWDGLQSSTDKLTKMGEQLILSYVKNINGVTIDSIRALFPGIKDLLPVFNYLQDKDYLAMQEVNRNHTLELLLDNDSASFINSLRTLSGIGTNTDALYLTKPPSKNEQKQNLWIDGKATNTIFGDGDSTVLTSSSELNGANQQHFNNIEHAQYFVNIEPIKSVLDWFGLAPPIAQAQINTNGLLIVYSDANVSLKSSDETNLSTNTAKSNIVLFTYFGKKQHKIEMKSMVAGSHQLNIILFKDNGDESDQKLIVNIKDNNQPQNVDFTTD